MPVPDPVVVPPVRSCYRVNYYVNGQPTLAYVCAFSAGEASAFLGVTDGSATASIVASPVEDAKADKAHALLPVAKPIVAEPPADPQFTQDELRRLRALLRQGQPVAQNSTVLNSAPAK